MLPLMKTPQSSMFVCAFVSAGLCVHMHTWAKLHEREFLHVSYSTLCRLSIDELPRAIPIQPGMYTSPGSPELWWVTSDPYLSQV